MHLSEQQEELECEFFVTLARFGDEATIEIMIDP